MSKYILVHGIRIAKDFTPETFGRLTTAGPAFLLSTSLTRRNLFQVCVCACGEEKVVRVYDIRREHTRSCGCFHDEASGDRNRRHSKKDAREYVVWKRMCSRCNNPNNSSYNDYGGRGITVCDRWREPNGQGFLNFLADMGQRPSSEYEIERNGVHGNYCPENCRWATRLEQARNKRNSRNLTYQGKTQNVNVWAEELDIKAFTILARLRLGWTVERALETPTRFQRKKGEE